MGRDRCAGTVCEVVEDGGGEGRVALGLFWAYIEAPADSTDRYLGTSFDGRPFDEALSWARARAVRVRVEIANASRAGYDRYSAGEIRIDGFPALPQELTAMRRVLKA